MKLKLGRVVTFLAGAMALLCAGAPVINAAAGDPDNPPPRINGSAVWPVTPQFVATAHAACDDILANISECFLVQMTKAGAPTAAVEFTRELYKSSHGEVGIMTGFQAAGPVDIAWVTYPLRANTNNGLLFVNGAPRLVNAEDLQLLDRKAMQQSAQFRNLKAAVPEVMMLPGDRDGKTWPNSTKAADGSIQFVLDYPLLNGCRACAREGKAFFNWNFSAKGTFAGTTFIGMTPPPLQ